MSEAEEKTSENIVENEKVEVLEGEVIDTPEKPKRRKKAGRPKGRHRDAIVRDKMFVAAYVKNGGNATKAAYEMTGATTPDSARQMGHKLKKRNEEAIELAMERYGLTQQKAMTRHAQLIDSESEAIAMKAIDTYYKVTKKTDTNGSDVNIHFNF